MITLFYKWRHVVSVWRQQKDALMTGLTFNSFVFYYFEYDKHNNGYKLIRSLGDR